MKLNICFYHCVVFIFFALFIISNALDFIMKKAEIFEYNKKYISNISVSVMQYSRRRKPVLNINCTNLHTWDNNVTIDFVYEEYIINDYRPSFVGMRFHFCDFLDAPYLYLKKIYGCQCPIKPGEMRFMNVSMHSGFPNFFPYKKGRLVVNIFIENTGDIIVKGGVYGDFRENK